MLWDVAVQYVLYIFSLFGSSVEVGIGLCVRLICPAGGAEWVTGGWLCLYVLLELCDSGIDAPFS